MFIDLLLLKVLGSHVRGSQKEEEVINWVLGHLEYDVNHYFIFKV